ncbi:hypothetical protein P153DRAFT_383581 [Dothidotthia symphoricarpi CBS 119687]|uniref:C2H2-type domain-containing protein n=1 Tax=Dothidotthia symphoricarpi CBS 119687 TaxID=1392245 RepID=A0A6A6AI46_9PLEO|nr:uncharacterized protein P153DRAFT_383581 [Dothidotthia symphoricarpi CBS 119687]KAF2131480.1 hypothetical protein P153DRAFT_383581 [Dothidotthia symphoricarpi CBS 119687]
MEPRRAFVHTTQPCESNRPNEAWGQRNDSSIGVEDNGWESRPPSCNDEFISNTHAPTFSNEQQSYHRPGGYLSNIDQIQENRGTVQGSFHLEQRNFGSRSQPLSHSRQPEQVLSTAGQDRHCAWNSRSEPTSLQTPWAPPSQSQYIDTRPHPQVSTNHHVRAFAHGPHTETEPQQLFPCSANDAARYNPLHVADHLKQYEQDVYPYHNQPVMAQSNLSTNPDPNTPFTIGRELSLDNDEPPWSTVCKRQDGLRGMGDPIARMVEHVGSSITGHTSNTDGIVMSNSDTTNPSTLDSSFDDDVDGLMVSSQATIGPSQPMQVDQSYAPDTSQGVSIENRAMRKPHEPPFQLAVRQSTPVPRTLTAFQQGFGPPSMSDGSDHWLSVSPSQATNSEPPSPANSSTPAHLPCEVCKTVFTGQYRKGNLNRHKRHKHKEAEAEYPCEDDNCAKTFKRMDARIKHYRRQHRHLAVGPCIRRTVSSPRRSIDVTGGRIEDSWFVDSQASSLLVNPADGTQNYYSGYAYAVQQFAQPDLREHDLQKIGTQHE